MDDGAHNQKTLTIKKYIVMNATAIFYDNTADAVLAVQTANGIVRHIFEKVSSMLNFAREMGIEIVSTRKEAAL